jgi:hypothetical protein
MFFDLPLSPYCSWRDVPCAKYCLRSFQRPVILLGFSSLLPQAENKKGNENYLTFLWELFDRLRLWKMWMSGRKLWREQLRQLLMQLWWWVMILPFDMSPMIPLKVQQNTVSHIPTTILCWDAINP